MIIAKGREPVKVKNRMQVLFEKLQGAYPDRVVSGLDKDHKHWAETALELSRELGYPNKNDFLEAYGFRVVRKEPSAPAGRPTSVDSAQVIKTLQARYPNGSGFSKLDDLFAANPDLLPFKKTLSNKAQSSFGMPLGQYLKRIGVLNGSAESLDEKIRILQDRYRDRPRPETLLQLKSENKDLKISAIDMLIRTQAKEEPIPYLLRHGILSEPKKNYIIVKVGFLGIDTKYYYKSNSKNICVGEYVEVPLGISDNMVFGVIEEVLFCTEDMAPCDVNMMKEISRKVAIREYQNNMLNSILMAVTSKDTIELIDTIPTTSFQEIFTPKQIVDHYIPWAHIRGLSSEVLKALNYLCLKDAQVYEETDIILLENGIAELLVYTDDVTDIMTRFPNIKMAMFAENEKNGMVDLLYSRSGYPAITDEYEIAPYKLNNKSKWSLRHSPVDTFVDGSIEYRFCFSDDWNSINYVITDSNKQRKQLRK